MTIYILSQIMTIGYRFFFPIFFKFCLIFI